MSPSQQLAQGLAELRLELPPDARQKLLDYLVLIEKWNKVYNLTAVRTQQKMVVHHLLDSLAVLPHISAHTILDVGSGAGLPGIPLAIALPRSAIVLLDSSHKKCAFLKQASIDLALANIEIVCSRLEFWRPHQTYELVISRAFSELPHFIAAAGGFCAQTGTLAAMKGVYPVEEIAQLPAGYRLHAAHSLMVPGLSRARHLVLVRRI
jgi:16S rRNA (guanine527-N7)-methyltransferase